MNTNSPSFEKLLALGLKIYKEVKDNFEGHNLVGFKLYYMFYSHSCDGMHLIFYIHLALSLEDREMLSIQSSWCRDTHIPNTHAHRQGSENIQMTLKISFSAEVSNSLC